jgi:hypothetical protein
MTARIRPNSGLANEPQSISDRVKSLAAGTTKLTPEDHSDRLLLSTNAAAAVTVVLPEAIGSGDAYKVQNLVDRSSGSLTFQVNTLTSNVMNAIIWSLDSTAVATDTTAWFMTNASQIALNGGTTGGVGGDYLEFIDVATGLWIVRGYTTTAGDKATPLTATSA